MRLPILICLGAVALAGCAQRGPVVAVKGAALPAARTYLITLDRPATGAEAAIDAALRQAGLTPVAAGRRPDYLVEVAYADRPAKTGAYVPGPTAAAPPAAWLQTAPKSSPLNVLKKGSQAVGVRVIDNASGATVRSVSASRYYRKARPGAVAKLGDAAARALGAP